MTLTSSLHAFRVNNLPVQIRNVHCIPIHNADSTHSSTGEVQRARTAETTGSDDNNSAFAQLSLRSHAESRENQLSAISGDSLIREGSSL
mmetsp:Transcript_16326/g.46049  ORF Transcript_16326/g.46049 Transcript_16326/m.46049 type:complete len:90 (-) Transcript_16326:203-472(-)